MKQLILISLLLVLGWSGIVYGQAESVAPEVDVDSNVPAGLTVGDLAPNFVAKTSATEKIELRSLLRTGPVVVVFYRGNWSVNCRHYLNNLKDSLALITSCGAMVLAVSPEKLEYQEKLGRLSSDSLLFLSDDTGAIMKGFDVGYVPSRSYMHKINHYRKTDLAEHNGEVGLRLPVPAVYVIASTGKISYVFFDDETDKRPSIAEIHDALVSLSR